MRKSSIARFARIQPILALLAGAVALSAVSAPAAQAGSTNGGNGAPIPKSQPPIVKLLGPPDFICFMGVVGGNGGCVPLGPLGQPPRVIVGCQIGIGCTATLSKD